MGHLLGILLHGASLRLIYRSVTSALHRSARACNVDRRLPCAGISTVD